MLLQQILYPLSCLSGLVLVQSLSPTATGDWSRSSSSLQPLQYVLSHPGNSLLLEDALGKGGSASEEDT